MYKIPPNQCSLSSLYLTLPKLSQTTSNNKESPRMAKESVRLNFTTNSNKNKNNRETNSEQPMMITVRSALAMLTANLNAQDSRVVVPLGHGDPSVFACFRTAVEAEDAIVDSVRSAKFNFYPPTVGILPARRAVAEYLSKDLPYKLSPNDVYLTLGCNQAIETIMSAIAQPGANILLPRPGFPYYEVRAEQNNLEARHFDLIPEKGWEIDLEAVEALADENTVAMVIVNPGNPCGNVYSYQHLKKVAETARKLGIIVITDEVYDHLVFGSKPFVPMGVFGSIVPVVTLGSLSKRWIIPGWRLGWLVTSDPTGTLQDSGVVDHITEFLSTASDPPTFIQGAVPQIIEKTKEDFFSKIVDLLRTSADICYDRIIEIPCITCPKKPEGSMFVMARLNPSALEGIEDDMDFCLKLAKQESVIVLPGIVVGMKNWLRITFAIEPSSLEDGLQRIKAFCQRHAKKT